MKYDLYIRKLGEHIRQLREEKGFTQEAFAAKINRDRQSYQRIELGKTNPTMHYLLDIAEGFNISFKELFNFSVEE
ncbi:MAG: helix-turn-helix domain-containing protein [Bacteroidota bacterium]